MSFVTIYKTFIFSLFGRFFDSFYYVGLVFLAYTVFFLALKVIKSCIIKRGVFDD